MKDVFRGEDVKFAHSRSCLLARATVYTGKSYGKGGLHILLLFILSAGFSLATKNGWQLFNVKSPNCFTYQWIRGVQSNTRILYHIHRHTDPPSSTYIIISKHAFESQSIEANYPPRSSILPNTTITTIHDYPNTH